MKTRIAKIKFGRFNLGALVASAAMMILKPLQPGRLSMDTLSRAIVLAFVITAISQTAFAHDKDFALPIECDDLDRLVVSNARNTYYVLEEVEDDEGEFRKKVVGLVVRGRLIWSRTSLSSDDNPEARNHYLYNRSRDARARNHYLYSRSRIARVLRSIVSASRTTWERACPETFPLDTKPTCTEDTSEPQVCICFNVGDVVDFTQCGEQLIADCESVGCRWFQDSAGNVVCDCS